MRWTSGQSWLLVTNHALCAPHFHVLPFHDARLAPADLLLPCGVRHFSLLSVLISCYFSVFTIQFNGSIHKAVHCAYEVQWFFYKFIINVCNGTSGQNLYRPRSGCNSWFSLAVCICSTVIEQHLDVTKTFGDSVSAGLVKGFETWIVSWLSCSS